MATSKSTAPKGKLISVKDLVKSKRGRTANVDQDMVSILGQLDLGTDQEAALLDGYDLFPMDPDASEAVVKAQRAARAAHSIEIRKAFRTAHYGHAGSKDLPGDFACSINYTPEGVAQVSRGKLVAVETAEATADA